MNETVYLERNPDVVSAASFFVWVVLRGGLSQLSQWHSDYVFPRQGPLSATWYALHRYVLPRLISFNMSELPPQGAFSTEKLNEFEAMIANSTVLEILIVHDIVLGSSVTARGAWWVRTWRVGSRSTAR